MYVKLRITLEDESWVEAMQEELLQFKLQQVWVLVDLPHGAKVIGTKWVYRNKKDERGQGLVASLKSRSIDKGRRYKRRKESTGKKVVSSLDFQEDNTGAEKINTASIEVNTASKVNTSSIELNTVIEQ
ncbi:hypothetical protein Tco_0342921, partial [Tanacetum coccineum]